jgi:hypothetical protein
VIKAEFEERQRKEAEELAADLKRQQVRREGSVCVDVTRKSRRSQTSRLSFSSRRTRPRLPNCVKRLCRYAGKI